MYTCFGITFKFHQNITKLTTYTTFTYVEYDGALKI